MEWNSLGNAASVQEQLLLNSSFFFNYKVKFLEFFAYLDYTIILKFYYVVTCHGVMSQHQKFALSLGALLRPNFVVCTCIMTIYADFSSIHFKCNINVMKESITITQSYFTPKTLFESFKTIYSIILYVTKVFFY